MLLFSETDDDMRLDKTEGIQIDCLCFLEANDDIRLGKTEEIQIDCFCFWRRMMICALSRLRKFRLTASVFKDDTVGG